MDFEDTADIAEIENFRRAAAVTSVVMGSRRVLRRRVMTEVDMIDDAIDGEIDMCLKDKGLSSKGRAAPLERGGLWTSNSAF